MKTIEQLDDMLKFGNTRKEIVQRAKELIDDTESQTLKQVREILKKYPKSYKFLVEDLNKELDKI